MTSDTKQAKIAKVPAPKSLPAVALFGNVRAERGRFLLECTKAGSVDQRIEALVNGTPIGSAGEIDVAGTGTDVVVTCRQFPSVELPCQVRFSNASGIVDVAPPFVLRTVMEVERLIGPGRVEDVRVSLKNGVIAGTGINRINGLGRPLLLGRVNGELLREIKIDRPRAREEGGASITFTLAVDPADLTESGAHYEVLGLPELTVLASLYFPRSDVGTLTASIARNEAAIENLTKRLHLEIARSGEMAEQRHAEQRQMMDAVVEYLIALVYDRFADRSDGRARIEEEETLRSFRKVIKDAGRGPNALDSLDYGAVLPNSAYFADGWSWLEQDTKGFHFRWMGLGGVILNPQPHRPVSRITVSIPTTYRDVAPDLSAIVDADPADVELVSSPNGAPYTLKVLPRSDGKARLVQVLRLVCGTAGRPADDVGTDDQRILSIAVSSGLFHYEI